MKTTYFATLLFCLTVFAGACPFVNAEEKAALNSTEADTQNAIVKREDFPELNLVFLQLKNGMRVCLKKTSTEEDVAVRLTALGGYASLPEKQRAAGRYASQIAIRSGFGGYYFDQLHAMLYDNAIEFDSEMLPFSRYIGGTADSERVSTLLSLIHTFFAEHRFTEHSFKKVMEKAKEQMIKKSKNSSKNFINIYHELSLPKEFYLKPLAISDIEQADYLKTKKFFEKSFTDPSDFVAVISGSFDMESLVKLVAKHLGAIPHFKSAKYFFEPPKAVKTVKKAKTKTVKSQKSYGDAMTIITLPIKEAVDESNFTAIENVSQLLYIHLKKLLRERYGVESVIVDATVEYPNYPYLKYPWIKIQYYCEPKLAAVMGKTILEELKNIQKKGVASEAIDRMNRKYRKAQNLREKNNGYWIATLSSYLLRDWKVGALPENLKPLEDEAQIKKGLQSFFSSDDYTIVFLQP